MGEEKAKGMWGTSVGTQALHLPPEGRWTQGPRPVDQEASDPSLKACGCSAGAPIAPCTRNQSPHQVPACVLPPTPMAGRAA